MRFLYCILVSDINFNLFSLCSILFTFLRISTEMWQRINLFTQTALNQSVPLSGSLFVIDFKFKQCSEAEQCTSTKTADVTEGGQERQMYIPALTLVAQLGNALRGEHFGPLPISWQWSAAPAGSPRAPLGPQEDHIHSVKRL
jgi:hypothetical protein